MLGLMNDDTRVHEERREVSRLLFSRPVNEAVVAAESCDDPSTEEPSPSAEDESGHEQEELA